MIRYLFLFSVAETSFESNEYSSDLDSSDSYTSESFEDSSYSDLSPEDENMEDERQGSDSEECIVVSSDEESMELEPPVTPSAPLTPGAQLELCMHHCSGQENEVNQNSSCRQDTCELDNIMELHIDNPQDTLLLLSPVGLPGLCLEVDGNDLQVTDFQHTDSLNNIFFLQIGCTHCMVYYNIYGPKCV